MKWNEALYTLNNQNKITSQELEVLLLLPIIRDEIFYPNYSIYYYEPQKPIYSEWNQPNNNNCYVLDFSLISEESNRKLALSFISMKNGDLVNAMITDTIFRLGEEKGWDNLIDMDILIQKRIAEPVNFDYRRLSSYQGSLEDKIRKCLKQIKHNYDTYAADIISGENWNSKARDTSFI